MDRTVMTSFFEPKPIHYTAWERLVFKLTGRWPQSVVDKRMSQLRAYELAQRREQFYPDSP
jgi:hypothetical protein